MPSKRPLPTDRRQTEASTDVRDVIRAVARAFNQVLGHRSEYNVPLARSSSSNTAAPAIRPLSPAHEHCCAQAVGHLSDVHVDGAMDSVTSASSIEYHCARQHPSIAPLPDGFIPHDTDGGLDSSMVAVPVRPSWSRCTQCHRSHDPARRCRCYACGSMHHSGIPCAMGSSNALRCPVCNFLHAPGPCAADIGPLAALCVQCGRCHLPTTRCKCRVCGAVHFASNACENVRAPSIQDVHIRAALSRQTVAAFDCGSPTEACPHCAALFFVGEAQYLSCCRKGTVVVNQPTVNPHIPIAICSSCT